MRAEQIRAVSGSRFRICTDEGTEFILYKSELGRFGIREGEEIGEEALRAITCELLPKRAKLRAMNLLKTKDYTVKQLRAKLEEGGYPESAVAEALSYVEGFHYTDDLRYAAGFIRSHAKDRSRMRIECDLLGKGIDRDTLEQAWALWEAEGGGQNEQAMAEALLEKREFDCRTATLKERQRMYGFLVRRGFSGELARRAVQMPGDI